MFALFVLLACCAHSDSPKDAPKLSATDLDGNPAILDSLLVDGPVYIAFWAIWCKSCVRELDELKPIYDEYHERGFELIAINEDGPRSAHRVKPMVKGKGWKYRVILDREKELLRRFQVISLPTSFLISQEGTIIEARQGFKPGMEKLVEEQLRGLLPEEKEELPESEGETAPELEEKTPPELEEGTAPELEEGTAPKSEEED